MKTLVIHPTDPSTDFLKPIYENATDATVVNGGLNSAQIAQLILEHDRIVMLGHGSPLGLFSVGQFDIPRGYVIDSSTVSLLQDKECIAIWCNANQFMKVHELKGFYSGMFISEVGEAHYCGLPGTSQEKVDESNHYFAKLVGEVINEPINKIYEHVSQQYELIIESNQVADYNWERLYLAD